MISGSLMTVNGWMVHGTCRLQRIGNSGYPEGCQPLTGSQPAAAAVVLIAAICSIHIGTLP